MHILIIGNGVAGITAARYIRKRSNHAITVVSAESKHFFSRTALMYVYMGHMRFEDIKPYEDWFWEKNRIDLLQAYVEKINTDKKTVSLSTGNDLPYDRLIIATGSVSNKFGWPGQDLRGVQGLYSLQDLENMETYSRDLTKAVIVGGGLIGIEMAEMFLSRGIEVCMLVREKYYWDNVLPEEEARMITDHIRDHHIDLRLETELKQILGNEEERAVAVETSKGETIECGFVGLTPGVHPNIKVVEGSPIECRKGILVNEYLETNIPGVYAIGDCAELRQPSPGRKAIEAVWYTGKLMGKTVARSICKEATPYRPGIWYNSAKFLDIEYQVYGSVPASGRSAENEESFYWEDAKRLRSLRLVFDRESRKLIGINVLGMRLRHNVADRFLREQWPVARVLQHFNALYFDPEFYRNPIREILKKFNTEYGDEGIKALDFKTVKHLVFEN
jgi:NAD(P)H-nitrite reductase large subunit